MTTIRQIESFCRAAAPYDLADDWDNIGLLIGDESAPADMVLLALDITAATAREARNLGAQLIISHHPVIFDPMRSLHPSSIPYLLAQYGIAALCLHTNLDRAEQGVNTCLAAALGLTDTTLYPEDYLVVGKPVSEMPADNFAALIKDRLGSPDVRYTSGRVCTVAVSSGGGGEGVELSARYGFDAFVTGELKHHHYLYALDHGIAAFDAGHFSTEDVVIRPLRDRLASAFPETEFVVSRACRCPYSAV